MRNTPLVSIICSTYNHELYISQCLDGFLLQKTTFSFEVLVHDDASTDNTPNIIRNFEDKYPEIIKPIYQKENQYSKGEDIFFKYQCARAQGKYIAICEGDDYWLDPLKLQKQVDFLEQNTDYGMIYTLSKIYDQKEEKITDSLFGSEYQGYDDLLAYNRIATLTTCIRTKAVREYLEDIKPQDKKWLMGDYPMWLWIGYHYKIKFISDITSVYRVLEESASHSNDIKKNEKFILSTIAITTFFIQKFNLLPTSQYHYALNEYYYRLYSEYKHLGNYTKAMYYVKLINNKYAPRRMRKEKKRFHLKYIKTQLLKFIARIITKKKPTS